MSYLLYMVDPASTKYQSKAVLWRLFLFQRGRTMTQERATELNNGGAAL